MEVYWLHLLQETKGLEEQSTKSKTPSTTLQTYYLLSHSHPAIMYFLEFKSIFPFFWSLSVLISESYFWIFVEKRTAEKREQAN